MINMCLYYFDSLCLWTKVCFARFSKLSQRVAVESPKTVYKNAVLAKRKHYQIMTSSFLKRHRARLAFQWSVVYACYSYRKSSLVLAIDTT